MRLLPTLALLLLAAPVLAQEVGYVQLATNAPAATLVVNGTPTALPADAPLALAPGTATLLLVAGGADTWDARRTTATVEVVAGDTAAVRLDLPVRYRLESVPYGATVTHEAADGARTALGATPLTLDLAQPLGGTLVVAKEGYATQRLTPGGDLTNAQSVLLRPLRAEAGAEIVGLPDPAPRRWIDVAAGVVAVAGAATAVYFKLQADDVDDRYRDPFSPERGDPALRDEARRLDTISAMGLGAMQVGLGVIAIRLVLR